MIGSFKLKELIDNEITQRRQEGYIVKDYNTDGLGTNELMKIYDELYSAEKDSSFGYDEPVELDEILAASTGCDYCEKPDGDTLYSKVYGAWLGRIVGCIMGKPHERYPYGSGTDRLSGWECIKLWQKGAGDEFPPVDYIRGNSTAADGYGFTIGCEDSLKENIKFAETDDDIRYLVLGLITNEKYGNDFTPSDISQIWRNYLTPSMVFTAEHRAMINALICQKTEKNEQLEFCHGYLNPFREWIGAQIRIDHYGYFNAGNPLAAAKSAYNDAIFSHVKNGVYGAMFFAALIASAFTEKDIMKCIGIAQSVIPLKSRLYEDIEFAVKLATEEKDIEEIYKALWKRFEGISNIHTNNNAAVCVAAIIYGNGDYVKSIGAAIGAGWDTDCNGATVGSFIGALKGDEAIPEYLRTPLNDTLYSSVLGFHPAKITECAKRTCNLIKLK